LRRPGPVANPAELPSGCADGCYPSLLATPTAVLKVGLMMIAVCMFAAGDRLLTLHISHMHARRQAAAMD
jgi:hypothetical protein